MKLMSLRIHWAASLVLLGTLFTGAALAAPTIFYSDLDSAPKRAFVTLWGKGFGSTRGAIEVGAGITVPEEIVSWTNTRIEFRLPAHASNNIRVVTSGNQRSNALPFVTRSSGRIFYVAANGNDRNNGLAPVTANGNGPWRNVTRAIDFVRPGDVVYVRNGTYTRIHNSTWKSNLLIPANRSGTAGNPIAITAYPGEKPVIGTTGTGATDRAVYMQPNVSHWTVAKLTLKARDTAIGFAQSGVASGIRMVGNVAGGIPSKYGTLRFNACTSCKVLGNHIYSSGQSGNKLAHLIYYGGFGPGANVEIAWNRLHDQRGGRAIQVYGHTDKDSLKGLSIHDNVIFNIPYDGILVGSSDAARKAWITDARVYSNTVYKVGHAGIRIDNPGVDALVAHNTIDRSGIGLRVQQAREIEALNNLFTGNTTGLKYEKAGVAIIENNGYTGTAPSREGMPHYGSPDYVDPATGNYALRSTSDFLNDGVVVNPVLPKVSVPAMSLPHLGALGWMVGR